MKVMPWTIGFAVVALAVCVGSSSAAPRSGASATSLCSVAKSVARDIVNSTSISSKAGVSAANLKTTYLKIKAAEPSLLGASSGALKTDLRQVFSFVNVVIVDFQKVNWQPSGILPYLPSLLPRAQKVEKPLQVVKGYFENTCKLHV
jgi:hypothetical protein